MTKSTHPAVLALAHGDVEQLLALHRRTFGALRMGPDPQPAAPTPPPPPADPPTSPTPSEPDFPPNTPVAEMTDKQQAAYYKAQARKHEDRNKAVGLTAEEAKSLRDKAQQYEALEREAMSDKDKAVAEAKDTAKAEARGVFLPLLVAAKFEAAAAGRIEPERLTGLLEPLDMSKFLTDSGDVDTAKVSAFVDGIAPAKGEPQQRGPSPHGQGVRPGTPSGPSVASGRELYQSKHKSRT